MSDFRSVLRPYSELLYDRVEALSDDSLQELMKACRSVTETNCWFVDYGAAKALLPIAETIAHGRRHKHEAGS